MRPIGRVMKFFDSAAILPFIAWSQLVQASDIPRRWICDDGLTVQVAEAGRAILIRLESGKTHRLPLASDVSGNLTWNEQGSSLCDNVQGLCAFSGSGEDRIFLFVFVNVEDEPLSCNSLD